MSLPVNSFLELLRFYAENCPEEIRGQRIISWKNIISQAAPKAQLLKTQNAFNHREHRGNR
jgi:hypothetical protein